MFDPNRTGYISAADLRLSMMNFGEHLTEGEADGLISYADVDRRGKIRYIGTVYNAIRFNNTRYINSTIQNL